jgi:hypothetical protein
VLWTATKRWGQPVADVQTYVVIPSVAGYTYTGYFDEEGTMYIDEHGLAAKDYWTDTLSVLNLYAKMQPNKYNIRYDLRGGTGTLPAQHINVKYDSTIMLPTYNGTKYGYTFGGWSMDSMEQEPQYLAGENAVGLVTEDNAWGVLYAVWIPNQTRIYIGLNAGQVDAYSYAGVRYGQPMPTLITRVKSPTRKGYTFKGYELNGHQYYDSVGHGISNWDRENPVDTIYAKWAAGAYSLRYDIQGGSMSAPAGENNISADNVITLAAYAGEKLGYTFDGWALTPGSEVKTYTAGGTAQCIGDNGAVVTLYAAWKPRTTMLSFDGNGGSFPMNIQIVAKYGKYVPSFILYPNRLGYNFAGIYDSASGGLQYYNEYGSSVRIWDKLDNESVLYVHWERCATELRFNANGGVGGPSGVQTIYYETELPAISAMPAKIGYEFAGYYNTTQTSGIMYYDSTGTSSGLWTGLQTRLTLYAHWRPQKTTLILDANGGSGGDLGSKTAVYGEYLPICQQLPTRGGYQFGGYYDLQQYGVKYYDEYGYSVRAWNKDNVPQQTLYAHWLGELFNITYMNMPADVIDTLPSTFNTGSGLELPAPRHNQYVFAGFYMDENFSGDAITHIMPSDAGDKVLYAKWTYTIEYNLNGGTGTALPVSNHLYNEMANIYPVPADWTKVGAEACLGWSTNPAAATAQFSKEGGIVNNLPVNKVVKLYAVWNAMTTRITLHSGSSAGGLTAANPEVIASYGSAMPALAALPQKEGYLFAGYYDAIEGGTQYYGSDGSSMRVWDKTMAETTLYARWVNERASNLTGMLISEGTLTPSFAPNIYEYTLTLPCTAATLNLSYPAGNVVKVNEQAITTSYNIDALPSFPNDELHIEVSSEGKLPVNYVVHLNIPLPSSSILYDSENAPNRMELSSEIANSSNYVAYQWYKDGVPLDAYDAVLEGAGVVVDGSVYGLRLYTMQMKEIVVCGQTAHVVPPSGTTAELLSVDPNPAATYINVSHPRLGLEQTTVRIYNASGGLSVSYPVDVGSSNVVNIDISMLAAGQYYVQVFGRSVSIVKQ